MKTNIFEDSEETGIKICKDGKEMTYLHLELMHISPKFSSFDDPSEIEKVGDIEILIHKLTENRTLIASDVGEFVSITLVNDEVVEIPFEPFFDEVIDLLYKIVKMYQSEGGIKFAFKW